LLLRSVGLVPAAMTRRARDVYLLRMIPFVERNYNMVELGPSYRRILVTA
jgi:ATP-dependent Lon protease